MPKGSQPVHRRLSCRVHIAGRTAKDICDMYSARLPKASMDLRHGSGQAGPAPPVSFLYLYPLLPCHRHPCPDCGIPHPYPAQDTESVLYIATSRFRRHLPSAHRRTKPLALPAL